MIRDIRPLTFSMITAATFFVTVAAQAIPLFSVDSATEELVRIDSVTGAVSVVGSLGINALDVDLARTSDGRLWALNSEFQTRVDLHEISMTTGAVLSSVQVTLGSVGIRSAEGLANSGNLLTLGYSSAGDSDADRFGNLAASGAISGSVTTAGVDIDGLGTGTGAVPYYAVDRFPLTFNRIFEFDPAGPSASLVVDMLDTFAPNDLVRSGTDILLIDNATPQLHRIDLGAPAVLNTIALDRPGTYLGLAFAGPVAPAQAPEPGVLSLLGIGLVGMAVVRRRRRTN